MLTTPEQDRVLIRSQNRGSRTYDIGGNRYPSVTSIISSGEPKPALVGWAKKVTAETAVTNRSTVETIIKTDGEQAAIDYLKGAGYRQRDAAGALGSKLHEVAEWELTQTEPYPAPKDTAARALIQNLRDFLVVSKPDWHAVEAVVYNADLGYAGTLDGVAVLPWLTPDPVLVDWKSGSGVYGSYAMQLSAYANATHIVGPKGPQAMLPVDLERAAVVHITPNGWKVYQVDISEWVFTAFVDCMEMAVWADRGNDAVGSVLAHGRARGGNGLTHPKVTAEIVKGNRTAAPIPAEAAKEFASRRRIVPPRLAK